jgi:GGDEF domain-containing protein
MQAFAGMVAAAAGKGSELARYAEERLALIMLETGLGDAIVRAERIGRSLCSGEAAALARPAIGVAQFRDDEALGHLIERAEDALDRARSDGALIVVAGQRARSARSRPPWML